MSGPRTSLDAMMRRDAGRGVSTNPRDLLRTRINFAELMEPVARALLGAPNERQSRIKDGKLRFGRKGSLAVDLRMGTWYDHEHNEGGGVLDLIRVEKGCADPVAWLRAEGYLA